MSLTINNQRKLTLLINNSNSRRMIVPFLFLSLFIQTCALYKFSVRFFHLTKFVRYFYFNRHVIAVIYSIILQMKCYRWCSTTPNWNTASNIKYRFERISYSFWLRIPKQIKSYISIVVHSERTRLLFVVCPTGDIIDFDFNIQ